MTFDINQIHLKPICYRKNELAFSTISNMRESNVISDSFLKVGKVIINAKKKGASSILMMGAHVIRSGVQKYIIDLMKRDLISCVAINGAGMIHDYEFSLIGETTESVASYIRDGQFGFWDETGKINDVINKAFNDSPDIGMGAAVGQAILEGNFPNKDISILAQAAKYNIPITTHVSIGQDIIHQHPNFNGAATGALSYNDFLIFAEIVQNLENGVVMNFGSAVMAPEVFLKALSMARNIASQNGQAIRKFTTLVCDLHDLPDDYRIEAKKENPSYYFRPWKTMLVRTVSDGGKAYYVKGRHAETIPQLWTAVNMVRNSI